jgi:hypothetical protein
MRVDASIAISKCFGDVAIILADCQRELNAMFKASTDDNAKSAQEHSIHSLMVSFLLYGQFATLYKKMYESTKKDLDEQCVAAGLEVDVPNGGSRVIAQSNVYQFGKNRNNATQTLAAKDLSIELTKLGIDKDILDKAIAAAEKERAGNVYYTVTGLD